MTISYNKLWNMLDDRHMKRKDLQRVSGISSATISRLGRNENISIKMLDKICNSLECDVSDVIEFIPSTD